ncbi:MAG: thioredoxin-disulfide reductase [Lachnospiraceae bacterium]|nr:thioredoxin-disulfide reductase [Lachnospiraceae bacterium]MDY4970806.1 thioredoxin-disulfide reductase [Lachnospiraceae bacterium]
MENTAETMIYDVVIAGSGPAGLAAAVYASRAELNALVIEKNYMSGGQIINTYEVDNYPGFPGINGFDLAMKFHEHAVKLGAHFATDEIDSVKKENDLWVLTGKNAVYRARTVLAACGAHHRKLGIPGEEEFAGKGVSYCATCDGAFYRDKTTAVIGGGDVAVEDAIFLARMCKKVYLVHRRNELRAAKSLQKKLMELPNVEILWNKVPDEIVGSQTVEKIYLSDTESGEQFDYDVDGVFVAVGITPDSQAFAGIAETDAQGYLKAGEDCVTSASGLFAAGDIRTKPLRQILTAAADGANAITSIEKYLNQL